MGKEDLDLHRNLICKCPAQFSSTVKHTYAFIFKGVIKNSVGLCVMVYAKWIDGKRTFYGEAVVQQKEHWTCMWKALVQTSALLPC